MRWLMMIWLLVAASAAMAERITIIGTGNVAGALGPEFAAQGHTIVYGSRDPDRDSVRELVARTGENASAKFRIATLIKAMGLDPIDVGPLKYGRWVEGMLILWINNRTSGRDSFDFYLRRTDG